MTTDAHEPARGLEALRSLSWGARAWLFVVVAIGIVQLVRGQWSDAVIFGVVGAVLAMDAAGFVRFEGSWGRPPRRALIVVGVVSAVPLCVLPRHSAGMAAAVIAIGLGAVAAAWPEHPSAAGPWPRGLRVLSIWWVAVWIAGCLWELVQVTRGGSLPGGRAAYPALSDLIDPVVGTTVGQVVFVALWLSVGAWLVRRGGR